MDGNLRALNRYLDELHRVEGYADACREIEDAILEATPDSKIGNYYGEELAEWQERIGEYRKNGGRSDRPRIAKRKTAEPVTACASMSGPALEV